ncbi:YggS family pyridoxal phosphate-dependent enzyme [Aquibacillus koreensis]|uniref:Pyridoxal phosphate homeostasis protein n=1 Tax=Aquibacillus koreensis TaxID=279446 RepID=A0A9X3WNJ8_9BACI|nr:YggS family pyridoxal phosphate-dependent enzyme [Aquibacillus koreensis]MCT2538046.1 YggS family pyridoxal phosphate-dependent enzyme [Aquibacillus koreensis]MDC3420569.1 YggS family pyridoxal phosphate-dependent enzyme [Aquibacillus koreensis]
MDVQANLQSIQQDILEVCQRVNRNPKEVNIIGVTKYVTIERAMQLIDAGVHQLGENRLEGFMEKYNALSSNEVKWHFIGSLQSRKVKDLIDKIDYIHSLDRKSLAKEINKRATKTISCFVQVNVSGEDSKHGLDSKEVHTFIEQLQDFNQIRVVGLMTMAPFVEDENIIRNSFRTLRLLRDEIKEKKMEHAPCNYLSMGMSNDYRIAIEEGATHIRIGSKLVGSM